MPADSSLTPSGTQRRRAAVVGLLAVALLAGAVLVALLLPRSDTGWPELKERIRERFPGVPQVSTGEVARWLAEDDRPPPLLVDARRPEEYAVSHLPGAVLAPGVEEAAALLAEAPGDRQVVVYCAVGWRSSAVAAALRERGFDRVVNLEGSIFEWANEGRPLVRHGERVEVVHPYDEEWGRYLERRRWSFGEGEP